MNQDLNTVRPSSAHRWMRCAYSAFAEGLLPRSSSPAAEIGTRTHAVAAARLYEALKRGFPKADISAPPVLEADAPKGDIYEDCVDCYVASVIEYLAATEETVERAGIEERVVKRAHGVDIWGTPDCWVYTRTKRLYIFDLKTGEVEVQAHNNEQLRLYASMVRAAKGLHAMRFELVIIQPRFPNHIKSECLDYGKLAEFTHIAGMCANAAAFAKADTPRHAGYHCRYCPARDLCFENNALARALDAAFVANVNSFDELPIDVIANIYAKMKDVASIADSLSALIKKRMSDGEESELVKLQTRKTKQWAISSPSELAEALGCSLDDISERKLLTPSKVAKSFDISGFVTTTETQALVVCSDKKTKK